MQTTLTLHSHNLEAAERYLCEDALRKAGTIIAAAEMLGITRHSMKRRIVKHHITWPVLGGPLPEDGAD